MDTTLEELLSYQTPKISKVFAGMLDTAEPNSEVKMIENGKFFYNNLMKDSDFVESLNSALERGVNVKIFLSPNPLSSVQIKDKADDIFSQAYGAYAYGGIKNLSNYIMGIGKIDKSLTKERAYEMAKDFENHLGNKKYLLRIRGFFSKLLGEYEIIGFNNLKNKLILDK
jgi:hypothetical protein